MGFLLHLVGVTAAVLGALMWGHHQARMKHRSANAIVLGVIDDALLWHGVRLGAAVAAVVALAPVLAPWLLWCWGQTPSEALINQTNLVGDTTLWAAILSTAIVPFTIMVVLPDFMLFATTMEAVKLRMGKSSPWWRTFLISCALGVALSLPIAAALAYAVVTVRIKHGIRPNASPGPEVEAIASADNQALITPPTWHVLRPSGRLARQGKRDIAQTMLDKSWHELPLPVRGRIARAAATHIVVLMTFYVAYTSMAVITGSII